MSKLRHIPVVVRLSTHDIHKADLMEELKVNRRHLTRELENQSPRYGWWASLYSTVSARVAKIQEQLESLEAELFIRYAKEGRAKRKADLKYHVAQNKKYREMKAHLRHWQDSERTLKFAEKAFDRRASLLQSINANTRKEFDS